jgi:hypothetical protein
MLISKYGNTPIKSWGRGSNSTHKHALKANRSFELNLFFKEGHYLKNK